MLTAGSLRIAYFSVRLARAFSCSTQFAKCCGAWGLFLALFGRHSRTQECLLLGEERKS
jgi:hypothetical protein